MGEHIWLVRNPEGRVIGASVTPAGAVRDVKSHCGATTGAAMTELSQVVYADRNAGSYKWAGYTLTREPLPTGTAGVTVTEEMVEAAAKILAYRLVGCTEKGWNGDAVFTAEQKAQILDDARVMLTAALAASTRTGDNA